LKWKVNRACRVIGNVGRSTANRNEPQVNRAINASSPFDAVSLARLRMTVGEALGEQWPQIIVRRIDRRSAHYREHKTQSSMKSVARLIAVSRSIPKQEPAK
jgi:hypothetical protein